MSSETDVTENRSGENIGADGPASACATRPGLESETTDTQMSSQPPLSKNQLKKQKKKEKWLQHKAQKRQQERDKRKKRFAEMRERGEEIGPSRKSLKKNRMVDSACQQRVVIDCSFDSFMTEKDISFLVQQIQHSYAANRRADNPLQLYMCGIQGKAKQRLDSIGDYKGWDIHKEERDFSEVFPKEEIVYLSSESPNVLDTLDDTKVYVIGGLVDHNHHKGLCHRLAEERGLAHAQLPIGQFLQLKSRKVLTINHVFEILLHFTETQDWQTSLLTVLPQRKGVCVKDSKDKDTDTTDDHQDASKSSPEVNSAICATVKAKQAVHSSMNEAKDTLISEPQDISTATDNGDSNATDVSLSEDVNVANRKEECEAVCSSSSTVDGICSNDVNKTETCTDI